MSLVPLALALASLATAPAPTRPPSGDAGVGQDAPGGPLSIFWEHALLKRLELEFVGDFGPFRLFAEKPRRPDPEHRPRVEALYGPWLAALGKAFEREVLQPQSRELAVSELPVVVLAGLPSFKNAARYEGTPHTHSNVVLYLEDVGALVTWWNRGIARVPEHELRTPVLYRAVEVLLAAHHTEGRLPQPRWAVEGLAGYLSAHGPDSNARDLERPAPSSAAVALVEEGVADERWTSQLLLPLEELAYVDGDDVRIAMLRVRAARAGASLDREGALALWRGQEALWMHFLLQGAGGRWRRSARRFLGRCLGEDLGLGELAETLGVSDLSELDAGFLTHLKRLTGDETVAEATLGVEPGTVHRPQLDVVPADARTRLAMALGRATQGDLQGALQRLEAALEVERSGDPQAARLEAELERMRATLDAREALLRGLAGPRANKLRVTFDGKGVTVPVQSYSDGVLTLGKNDSGRRELPASEIPPLDLARALPKAKGLKPPSWVVPYLFLLGENERWDRKLRLDDEQGAALATAAQSGLIALVHEGAALARLADLARTPSPRGVEEAREVVAAASELALRYVDTAAVVEVRDALRAAAAEAYGAIYDATVLESLLHGKLETIGQGRVRVTYEFDDPQEAGDFSTVRGYLGERTGHLPPLTSAPPDAELAVRGGNFEGKGHLAYRHLLSFEAPMVVRYQLLYGRARSQGAGITVLMALCDDGQGSYVGAWDVFDLEAIDKPSSFVRTAYHQGKRIPAFAKTYDVELRHEGRLATLVVNGERKQQVPTGGRASGSVLFWVHADVTVALRRLEIEGTLVSGEANSARTAWVTEQLAGAGFGS